MASPTTMSGGEPIALIRLAEPVGRPFRAPSLWHAYAATWSLVSPTVSGRRDSGDGDDGRASSGALADVTDRLGGLTQG